LRIYISGPMTGIPNLNRTAFKDEATRLWIQGFDVMDPHNLAPARLKGESDDDYYVRCLEADLEALGQCDAIKLLPGWQDSKGSRIELHRALELGLKVFA
jgi:hypothetical protein